MLGWLLPAIGAGLGEARMIAGAKSGLSSGERLPCLARRNDFGHVWVGLIPDLQKSLIMRTGLLAFALAFMRLRQMIMRSLVQCLSRTFICKPL
jgi:hypothetical protein